MIFGDKAHCRIEKSAMKNILVFRELNEWNCTSERGIKMKEKRKSIREKFVIKKWG